MKNSTRLRAIRLAYGVSLQELAAVVGVSSQYMSRVELGQVPPTWTLEKRCEAAFERIIMDRYEMARALERDCHAAARRLLEAPEEEDGNGI